MIVSSVFILVFFIWRYHKKGRHESYKEPFPLKTCQTCLRSIYRSMTEFSALGRCFLELFRDGGPKHIETSHIETNGLVSI